MAQITNRREPGGLDRRGQKLPDGMTLIPWSKERHLAWDFTCSYMLSTTYIPKTSVDVGMLDNRQEEMKLKRYENLASSHIVMPVGIETLGSWGSMGLSFIKELGLRITTVTKENIATTFPFQALSLAIQRGNAISVMNTVPNMRNL